jgi:hypothetical protein
VRSGHDEEKLRVSELMDLLVGPPYMGHDRQLFGCRPIVQLNRIVRRDQLCAVVTDDGRPRVLGNQTPHDRRVGDCMLRVVAHGRRA